MHFFISYNHADRQWARWIAWHLEEARHQVTFDEWDFSPGTNFVMQMHKATVRADRTIAVLSPAYLTAEYTYSEWMAVYQQDPTSELGKLVPVRVRACEPVGLLAPIKYINLVDLPESEARDALLIGVTGARTKPLIPPLFPVAGGTLVRMPVVERPQRPQYPESTAPVAFSVEHGDITKFQADTVVLKYAQAFHGADNATMRHLTAAGIAKAALSPDIGDYRYVDTRGAIRASHALFLGVKPLWGLGYRDMREFAVLALTSLVRQAAPVEHLAMTIHGPGFGLDEMQSVLALADGLLDCLAGGTLPKTLRRISIVEIDSARVERLRRLLAEKMGRAAFNW